MVTPLCRETQSLGQQMLNAPVGINGLISIMQLKTDMILLQANLHMQFMFTYVLQFTIQINICFIINEFTYAKSFCLALNLSLI